MRIRAARKGTRRWIKLLSFTLPTCILYRSCSRPRKVSIITYCGVILPEPRPRVISVSTSGGITS